MGKSISKIIYIAILVLMVITASASACTFCMATLSGKTLFGSNEDFWDSDTNIWFYPAEEGKYGRFFVGYNNGFPQGGMNDKGLSFDGASTPKSDLKFSKGKKTHNGYLIEKILEECATVEEALKIVEEYQFTELRGQGQLMFVDALGDAFIVGGPGRRGKDIDVIRKKGDFQVLTNFFPSYPKKGGSSSFNRYNLATRKLEKDATPSVENFVSILNAVHQESPKSSTVYSFILDLNEKVIHLYYFHNFNDAVKIRLEDEIKKGPHTYKLLSLFPESTISQKALRVFNHKKKSSSLSRNLPKLVDYKNVN